jgi:hypothetical protein
VPSVRFERASVNIAGSPIELTVRVQPEHAQNLERYARAATTTLRTYGDWLGPLPYHTLAIVDPAWRAMAPVAPDAIVLDRTPWWNARATMTPELATVRGVSRRVWRDAMAAGTVPAWFVDGLAEYASRRIVASLFEKENNPPGYAFLEERYFGGFVPRFVRIRLRAEADGDPVSAYRLRPEVRVSTSPESSTDARTLTAKTVLALGTLERWLGRPVFDEAVAEFVQLCRRGTATLGDFERVASEVGGQDLSWFFEPTFRSSSIFDYGIERLASARQTDGDYLTTIVARRYGDATFTGRTAPRVGSFESGRGLVLRTAFADGAAATDYWDGRDRTKVFTYRSATVAISAEIDPDRTILLDVHRTNNSASINPQGSTAATRWAARYVNWVINALLQYATLV